MRCPYQSNWVWVTTTVLCHYHNWREKWVWAAISTTFFQMQSLFSCSTKLWLLWVPSNFHFFALMTRFAQKCVHPNCTFRCVKVRKWQNKPLNSTEYWPRETQSITEGLRNFLAHDQLIKTYWNYVEICNKLFQFVVTIYLWCTAINNRLSQDSCRHCCCQCDVTAGMPTRRRWTRYTID